LTRGIWCLWCAPGFIPRESGHLVSTLDFEGQPVKNLSFSAQKGKERSMKIRPLQDRVIVKRIAEEEKTKGGIIIPDTAKEKPQEGKVVAVGKGKVNDDGKLTALDVKVGDKILFGKYSGSEIKLNGEEHLIMREDDILGVIEG
jgi:chaperonin GroES